MRDLYSKNTATQPMTMTTLQRIALQERVPKSKLSALERMFNAMTQGNDSKKQLSFRQFSKCMRSVNWVYCKSQFTESQKPTYRQQV